MARSDGTCWEVLGVNAESLAAPHTVTPPRCCDVVCFPRDPHESRRTLMVFGGFGGLLVASGPALGAAKLPTLDFLPAWTAKPVSRLCKPCPGRPNSVNSG